MIWLTADSTNAVEIASPLRQRIAQAHKSAGAPNPVAERQVREILAGIVRTKTVAQKRKDALTTDRLEHAVKALVTGLKGQRDRALLLLTFACAMRRAEAAALDVADLRFDARGLVVTLRRSKTDQEGQGLAMAAKMLRNTAFWPSASRCANSICRISRRRPCLSRPKSLAMPVASHFSGSSPIV